jgi:hypothetical protein
MPPTHCVISAAHVASRVCVMRRKDFDASKRPLEVCKESVVNAEKLGE